MTAIAEAKPWDLSHVLDLVNSLSFLPDSSTTPLRSTHKPDQSYRNTQTEDDKTHSNRGHEDQLREDLDGLGDFSKLWQFLGSPNDSPKATLAVQTPSKDDEQLLSFRTTTGYASDSFVYSHSPNRSKATPKQKQKQINTTSLKELNGSDDQDADTVSDGSANPDTPTLTKSQRKKRNRKERKAKEAVTTKQTATSTLTSLSDPEAKTISQPMPSKVAPSRPVDIVTPRPQHTLRPRDSSGKVISAADFDDALSEAVRKVDVAKKANKSAVTHQQNQIPGTTYTELNKASTRRQSNPGPLPSQDGSISAYTALRNGASGGPKVTPKNGNAHQLVPATVAPIQLSATAPSGDQQKALTSHVLPAAKRSNAIEPIVVRSGEDRHWALLMKLIRDFYGDRKHLISPMNLTTHNNDPKGLHIFVDASNIFIGFKDQLKRSRGIPWHVQVPAVDLSFDALALLMERRRPVAKRVLVGSTPHLPAFDKAKAVGYECSILEKVYKARELTERQIYFKELDHANHIRKRAKAPPANNVATLNGLNGGGSGSGSETNAPQYAPARMIEQGVDEILHLKLLESIVDTEAPSTIVLATGDAAQAEYSEGFMAMAERALKKGWTVELVSWSKNISAMYTRREWVKAWGERFRIVTLDDYAEELLDM